jgi:glycosyltransferase involved in cell wall biosynthesis
MPKNLRKILLLYDSLLAAGGAERLFLEEERYFQGRGYDVTTAVFEWDRQALLDYHPRKLVCLSARGHFMRVARLVKFLWVSRPDLVVAPSNSEAVYLFLAGWFAPVRYAVHVHGSHFWFETDRLKYAWIHRGIFERIRNSVFGHRQFLPAKMRLAWPARLVNEAVALLDYWAIRGACARIALTNQVGWEIELLYGKKTGVCRGCLSEEWLALGARRRVAEPECARVPGLIFSVGRLDPRKRVDVLLRAFAQIAREKPGLRLVVGGTGPEAGNLQSLARELGIQDRVEFCGFISDADLPGHYLRAEVFAFPSWTTSGITPYEALAFGCKVVWTSEAEEPVLNFPGVQVADPTPEDFARAMQRALRDPSPPPLEGLRNYSWQRYFEGVEQILVGSSCGASGQPLLKNSASAPAVPASEG